VPGDGRDPRRSDRGSRQRPPLAPPQHRRRLDRQETHSRLLRTQAMAHIVLDTGGGGGLADGLPVTLELPEEGRCELEIDNGKLEIGL